MKNIRHIGIVVKDINKSIIFYRDLLGLKIEKDMLEKSPYIDKILGLKDVSMRTIKLSASDGSLVELLCYSNPVSRDGRKSRINDLGCAHIAFTVNNIGKEYRRLLKKGIFFKSPPCKSPDGYAKVAFCRNPDGTFIELVEILGRKPRVAK